MSTLTNIFLDIANSIRSKAGVATTYKPSEMAAAINNINTGGGSSTIYRYHILTKTTGGVDATITVEKYINESLISSVDYLYSDVKNNPVNYDNFFEIGYPNEQRITWLKSNIEHGTGYIESQQYYENVNFSISFTNDVIIGGTYPMNRFVGAFNEPITIAEDTTDLSYLLYPMPQAFTSFNQPINIPETCTSLTTAFRECASFNQSLNIPANVISISYMLMNCINFNSPINIVEGSLLEMKETFRGCTNFNQPVYIPSTITNATSAFSGCTNFNQPINFSRNIDLPYTSFGLFLSGCTNFNSPINLLANVATTYMCNMLRNFNAPVTIERVYANAFRTFADCNELNSPITINSAIGSTIFSSMFERCYNFNQPFTIPNNVINVGYMFNQCLNFNSNISFSETIYDYTNCFRGCINFNASINMPNTIIFSSGAQPSAGMNAMFFDCSNFNQPLNIPNGIFNMRDTFYNCHNFNQPLNIPNSVVSLRNCFRYCYNFNQPMRIPDSVTDLYATFLGCNNFENVVIVENAIKIPSANQSGTFQNCNNSKRKEIHIGVGTNMNNLIYQKGSGSLVGASITYSTNDICAQNEAYNIYIYNDR